jgi:pimeloyl-ACP methyl ester carboxylesterase
MMNRFGKSVLAAALGLALFGCDETNDPPALQPDAGVVVTTPDAGDVDPAIAACQSTIAAKLAEVQGAGLDPATWSIEDAEEMREITTDVPQTKETYQDYDGHYRPLSNHPGCSVTNLYYDKSNTANGSAGQTPYATVADGTGGNNDGKWTGSSAYNGVNAASAFADGNKANIPGYACAAKEYAQPDEDTTKPIVILVHGNSTRPHTWEKFILPDGVEPTQSLENVQVNEDRGTARAQLADKLVAARYKVVAVDFRTDLVNALDPSDPGAEYNSAGNIDHGWSTPILQSLVKAVITNNPGRKVALIGHSLGVTVARDALRRLYVEHSKGVAGAVNPFEHVSHVILGSGANQGVSTYEQQLCQVNKTMRGTIVCEMGSRAAYTQTYFAKPLNGPLGLFSTPCADGDYAFGKTGQCGGNRVKYFTITMTDIEKGSNYQDYYVSEAASRLNMDGCATNTLTTLNDYDTSGYFVGGFIANHFGSMRSEAGLALTMQYLAQ